ncbi:MAG: hypothetical protein IPM67_05565 [Sphingomonadales bacterium]|nr:hypothetical protein [Sphingomonadales bacterium]MBK9268114.1 hypothetical protein [Sphingomonadales bacterium]MBP6433649.1 hypothetical protein [Sphingorhabdus sp.]
MSMSFGGIGKLVSLALLGAISVPVAGVAAAPMIAVTSSVVLSSEAMVERVETGADGQERVVLKQPKDVIVVPGDRVIFTLRYMNKGSEAASGFRATNPMPGPVQFVSAEEDWAEVSVDGGVSWGKLTELKVAVKGIDGAPATVRAAAAEDVTHVRWVFTAPIAPGAQGTVSYRGLIK